MTLTTLTRTVVALWILGSPWVLVAQETPVETLPEVRHVQILDSHGLAPEIARAGKLYSLEEFNSPRLFYADPGTTLEELSNLPNGTYIVIGKPRSDSYSTGIIESGAFWPGTYRAGQFVPGVHQASGFRPGIFTRGGFLDGLLIDDQHFVPGIVFRERFIAGVFRGEWFIPGSFRGETFVPGMIVDGLFLPGGFMGRMGFVPGVFVGGGFIPGRGGANGFEPGMWRRGGFRRGPGGELIGIGFGNGGVPGSQGSLGGFLDLDDAGELGGFGPSQRRGQQDWGPGGAFRYMPGVGLMPQFVETSASHVAAGANEGPQDIDEDDSANSETVNQEQAENTTIDGASSSESTEEQGYFSRIGESWGRSDGVTSCSPLVMDKAERESCIQEFQEIGKAMGESIDEIIRGLMGEYPADPWGDGGIIEGQAPFYPADIDGPTGPVFRSVELYPADPDSEPLGPHFRATALFYPADIDGDGPSLPEARGFLKGVAPAATRRHVP